MVNESIVSSVANSVPIPLETFAGLMQAIGGLLVIYVIASIVSAVLNWKKNKEIKKMGKDIKEIKKKIESLSSKSGKSKKKN